MIFENVVQYITKKAKNENLEPEKKGLKCHFISIKEYIDKAR